MSEADDSDLTDRDTTGSEATASEKEEEKPKKEERKKTETRKEKRKRFFDRLREKRRHIPDAENSNEKEEIRIDGIAIERVAEFTYLGAQFDEFCDDLYDIERRILLGTRRWVGSAKHSGTKTQPGG